MQDEIFQTKNILEEFLETMRYCLQKGIPQIAAVMGSCVAGGAYLPIMSDEALIVENGLDIFSRILPRKAAIGEDIDNETLGGAATH